GDGNQPLVTRTITDATPARQWTKSAGRLGYKQSWIVLNPRAAMSELPETILQFGSGKFLRGFADLFIHQANEEGQRVGRVVVVQTTGDSRANLLTDQGGRYHVAVRGLAGGQIVDRVEDSASISRALFASRQW